MLQCFVNQAKNPILIHVVSVEEYPTWVAKQPTQSKNWLSSTRFLNEPYSVRMIPHADGSLACVICCVDKKENLWGVGHLPFVLPEGEYAFDPNNPFYQNYAIAWGLGAYQFNQYKKPIRKPAQLYLPANLPIAKIKTIVESIYFVRDLINTPTDDMGPTQLATAAANVAKQFGAKFTEIVGEDLLKQNYASIYTVGRASDDPPRLLDLRWGKSSHPKVTLVGKGVCFDSGGLDLKPSSAMLLMKKDMAGAAHVLGLARMIMETQLPICLRVLLPVVENVVSGNAYRPGDIIKSRKGITIEIGNTDAEGRVILADALTEAVSEKPEMLVDITTLTGAARVALGTELPAIFSNHDQLVDEVIQQGKKEQDPVWRLPLFGLYREFLNSPIADINNNTFEPYGGAITAALFLKEFVPDDVPWLHFDMMAWNLRPRPGRPQGGEAMGLRGLFQYLCKRYG